MPQAETGNTGNGGITINAGTANIDNSQFAGQDMINTFSTGDEALHTGDKRRDEQYETARNWSVKACVISIYPDAIWTRLI